MTINEIKNYVDNYIVQNGNVYLKDDNQQILDEETILKVKSARLIYNQARESIKVMLNNLENLMEIFLDILQK